jgi:hypothetical protein
MVDFIEPVINHDLDFLGIYAQSRDGGSGLCSHHQTLLHKKLTGRHKINGHVPFDGRPSSLHADFMT